MNERMIKKVLWSSLLVLSLIVAVLGNSTTVFADNSSSYVVKVACGFFHTVVLKSDGTVWAWGGNGAGQLGDGTDTNKPIPVQVSGLTDVIAIAAGTSHTSWAMELIRIDIPRFRAGVSAAYRVLPQELPTL